MSDAAAAGRQRARSGVAIAGACFFFWGLYPFYFKALAPGRRLEVVANRILWSALFLACLLPFGGAYRELLATLRAPRRAATLLLTGYLILTNWTVYVVAVQGGQVLDASLGYFLGPLISVALGVIVLRERLSRVQTVAVLLATLAVLNLIWQLGVVPEGGPGAGRLVQRLRPAAQAPPGRSRSSACSSSAS